jgi:phosphoribosylformylglycinamidine synthase
MTPRSPRSPLSPGQPRTPRALVLRTAGTNCDRETCLALEQAGAQVDLVHVRELFRAPERLASAELCVVPGGFSYGDDVAAGRILGYEVRQHLSAAARDCVANGGFVLGVCNGFQVLVDTGLLQPAGEDRLFSLTGNASGRFECRWVHVQVEDSACAWLAPLDKGSVIPMPVAHAEGRLVVQDERALARLVERRQIALRYVTADGGAAAYPDNPNGSERDIAGLCDPTGRVLGLMPHPERNITPWQHPQWTRMPPRAEGQGLDFYRRIVAAAGARASSTRRDALGTTP